MKLTVIVPAYNEEGRIGPCLDALSSIWGVHQCIVVDGASSDRTLVEARDYDGVTVIESSRGRGLQQNVGAENASGDTLLFLHADTVLPARAVETVDATLQTPGVVAGAFRTWHVPQRWQGQRRSWLLHLADLRSRYSRLPYGDQALFMRADVFRRVGGFPATPLMEDLEMSRRLSRLGKIRVTDARVQVSGRRFESAPLYQTLLVNAFPFLYSAGVPTFVLARLYGNPR